MALGSSSPCTPRSRPAEASFTNAARGTGRLSGVLAACSGPDRSAAIAGRTRTVGGAAAAAAVVAGTAIVPRRRAFDSGLCARRQLYSTTLRRSRTHAAASLLSPTQLQQIEELIDCPTHGKTGGPRFKFEAAEVQAMLQKRQCSMDTLLLSFLRDAAVWARPLISGYHVG